MMCQIELVWFWLGRVLWHINRCRLSNATFCLYMYIKYLICKHILMRIFLFEPELIFLANCYMVSSNSIEYKSFYLHRVKWFQVLLFINNKSIIYQTFLYTQGANNSVQHKYTVISIQPIGWIISSATTPGQNEPSKR